MGCIASHCIGTTRRALSRSCALDDAGGPTRDFFPEKTAVSELHLAGFCD